MEESADAKEDENKKIVHTYPLVRVGTFIYMCTYDFSFSSDIYHIC